MARAFAREFRAPLIYAEVTRLLVELNRSPGHPALFSVASRELDEATREKVLARYYRPYRRRVEEAVEALLRAKPRGAPGGARTEGRLDARGRSPVVLHLSVHTFTPVLRGVRRDADIGILYDPRRAGEKRFAIDWARAIRAAAPELRVRRNYPYRGNADGLTTTLRRRFPPSRYLGIELEVNQRFFVAGRAASARRGPLAARDARLPVTRALLVSLAAAGVFPSPWPRGSSHA